MMSNLSIGRKSRSFVIGVLACLSMFALFTNTLHAQTAGAGTIKGTVTDSSEASVAGAIVTVTNADTGVAHEYTSNGAGLYVAPFLQPGHYTVAATATGFGKVSANNLTLQVGQTMTIDLGLKVQSGSTTVEVSGETPILNAEQIEAMRKVCRLGREVLDIAAAAAQPGVTTDYIDEVVHKACIERDVSWSWGKCK